MLSGQRSGRYSGLCLQAVGSGLCEQRLRAHDESALEVAPPDRRLDRRPTAFSTMRYTNRQPLLHIVDVDDFFDYGVTPAADVTMNAIDKECINYLSDTDWTDHAVTVP